MNLARLSKKVPHADSRKTLTAFHEEKLREFEEYYAQLPEKKKLLEQLKKRALALPTEVTVENYDAELNRRTILAEQISKLEDEIEKMESKDEYHRYLMKSASFLDEYHRTHIKEEPVQEKEEPIHEEDYDGESEEDSSSDEEENANPLVVRVKKPQKRGLTNFVDEYKISQKGDICRRYAKECLGIIMEDTRKNNKEEYFRLRETMICQNCQVNRILNNKEATLVCPQCGDSRIYNEEAQKTEWREEVEILSPFAYKRVRLALKSMLPCTFRLCVWETCKTPEMGIIIPLVSC